MGTYSNVSVSSVKGTKSIAPNENYTVKFTVTSTSGGMGISTIRCNLFAVIGGKYYFISKYGTVSNAGVTAGTSKTFTLTMKSLSFGEACSSPYPPTSGSNLFDYLRSNGTRSVTIKVMFVEVYTLSGMVSSPIEVSISGLAAMRERLNPRFIAFRFERCLGDGTINDEGERLSTTMRLAFSGAYSEFTLALTLYSVSGSTQTAVKTVTISSSDSRMATLITGVSNNTIFVNDFTVAKGVNYVIKGVISSTLESGSASCSIPKSFANMHLSAASNGGVAFGSFSSSTNNTPKFENSYPAYFYSSLAVSGAASVGGAATVTGALTAKGGIANIKGGYVTGITSAVDGDNTVNIPFGVTFKSTPFTTISLYGSENLSKISIQITAVSTTSMNVRVINNGSSSHSLGIAWMAYGTLS